jgi:hypothetical protein
MRIRDHSGGNSEIAKRVSGVEICGGEHDAGKIQAITRPLRDGELLKV